MFGLRASAEPQRQTPRGDASWHVAGHGCTLGGALNGELGYQHAILKSVSNHGSGRWCP